VGTDRHPVAPVRPRARAVYLSYAAVTLLVAVLVAAPVVRARRRRAAKSPMLEGGIPS
jgi:hypothetical protein